MDEITLLDESLPSAAGPAPDVCVASRHALVTEMRRPSTVGQPTRWRGPRRLLATAAAVVVVTAGVTVAQNVGGGPERGVLPGPAVASAAELGAAAAAAAEREPWVKPRPDQWLYLRTRNADGFDMNRGWEGVDPSVTNDVPLWSRVDGTAVAFVGRSGRLRVLEHRSPPTPFDIASYDTLPTERHALLARLRTPFNGQEGPTTDASVFDTIGSMLAHPLPPALRAALFRLLPTLDGVTMRRDVADQIGRRGVAFEVRGDNDRMEIILDPATYRYLGSRWVATRDYGRPGQATKAGTVLLSSAVVESRIVDHPGDRR
jgi:hypothetical protein